MQQIEAIGPGTRLDATGARGNESTGQSVLDTEYAVSPRFRQVFYYDRLSHSVQPLRDLGRALA